jgi:predicted AAA+ superfamily ATPase
MIKRQAEETLRRLAMQFPVVGVTGPRQSGKSTLVTSVFPHKRYVTFDDKDMREVAASAPHDFLLAFPDGAIIDEAQKVPEIFDAIKKKVDEGPYQPGTYILTGSSQFHLRKNMTDSLAGRAAFLTLLPFSLKELRDAQLLPDIPYELAYQGFYPPLHDKTKHYLPEDWFEAYINTYLDLDVNESINFSHLSTFRTFLTLCADMSGKMLSMNALSNAVGVSVPTVRNWLSILEASYIIHFLQPDSTNLGKAVVKTPKLYFVDTGLLCHLLRFDSPEALILSTSKGPVIETLAVAELLKQRLNQGKRPNLTFYRDRSGLEVDTIADWKQDFAIEVKSDQGVEKKHASNIVKYLALKHQEPMKGVVWYLGDTRFTLQGIPYIPWKEWADFEDSQAE